MSNVNSPLHSVDFEYASDREDLKPNGSLPKRLSKINISEGTYSSHISFFQTYFSDNGPQAFADHLNISNSDKVWMRKHLKLDSIKYSSGNLSLPSHQFEYYGLNGTSNGSFFVAQLSQATDHQGYYNAALNNNHEEHTIPSTTYTFSDGRQVSGGNALIDREPSFNASIAGLLRKYTLPAGGNTIISYESNMHWNDDSFSSESSQQSVTDDDCLIFQESHHQFSLFITEDMHDYGKVILKLDPLCGTTGTGSVDIRRGGNSYFLEGIYNNVTDSIVIPLNSPDHSIVPGYLYTFDIRANDARSTCYVRTSYNGMSEDVGGLRVASTRTYDNYSFSNDIIRNYSYQQENGNSSGILFRHPTYVFNYGFDILFSTNSIFNLQSFEGHHIGYERVETDHSGNGTEIQEFYADTPESQSFFDFPSVPESERTLNGQLKQHLILSESGDTLQQTINYLTSRTLQPLPFKNFSFVRLPGIVIPPYHDYVNIYQINSGIYRPDSIVVIKDGVKRTTHQDYNFNDHLFPTYTKTVDAYNRNNYEEYTQYTSNYQYPNSDQVLPYFDERNIIQPFNVRRLKNANALNHTFTIYDMFDDHARPSRSVVSSYNLGTSPILHDSTLYNTYNTDGLVTSLTLPNFLNDNTYTYNSQKLMTSSTFGPLTEQFIYEPNTSLLSSKIAADQTSQYFTYDALMRLKTTTDCTGASSTYNYNIVNDDQSYFETIQSFPADLNGLSQLTELRSREYFDGLSRSLQIVSVAQSPNGNDQIKAVNYDNQGRVSHSYEVFESDHSDGSFVSVVAKIPFTLSEYEASPLNRVSANTIPEWEDKTSLTRYGSNTVADQVIDHDSSGFYLPGTLYKTTQIDANGNQNISFSDEAGRLLLSRRADTLDSPASRHDTYSLYDGKDRKREVIPPGAVPGDPNLNYYYNYDAEDKTTSKKIPSKGWNEYIYSDRDLMIAMRDSNLVLENKWFVYNYDFINRELKSGFQNNGTPPSTDNPTIDELHLSKVYGTSAIDIDKIATQSTKILGTDDFINQFNSYDNCGRVSHTASNNHIDPTIISDSTIYKYNGASNVVSLRQRTVGYNDDVNIIIDEKEIDDDGRVIGQWLAHNELRQQLCAVDHTIKNQIKTKYIGGNSDHHLQKIDYVYMDNQLLRSINGGVATGGDLFGYQLNYYQDPTHANSSTGSPVAQYNGNISSIDWQAATESQQLEIYSYNHLDRLKHNYSNQDYFNTSYSYDHRGNFSTINRNALIDDSAILIDNLTAHFPIDQNQMNRMTDVALPNEGYKMKDPNELYEYDENGNMTRDPQKGVTMSYNHLDLCTEVIWDSAGEPNGEERRINFLYSADGSMLQQITSQKGRDIRTQDYVGQVEYIEHLPYIVHHTEGRIVNHGVEEYLKYLFLDHEQTKSGVFGAVQIESVGQIMEDQTDYTASECIVMESGFAVDETAIYEAHILPPPPYQADWQDEWDFRDHLGNLRLTYADLNGDGQIKASSEILQRIDYYPYGLRRSSQEVTALKNNYQFNNTELINDFGLYINMSAKRSLDGALGCWGQVDFYSDKYPALSPYNYVTNNPINAIDPDGRYIIFINGLRLFQASVDQYGWIGGLGGKTGIYTKDEFAYWRTYNGTLNSFGVGNIDIVKWFTDKYFDRKVLFASGSSYWNSSAALRRGEGMAKAELFHQMIQNKEITLAEGETIKIISHSQGGAHGAGFAEQLMSYVDADGNPLYNVEAIEYITPHQPTDITHPDGPVGIQYSHENDAVSGNDAPWWMPNGGTAHGPINNIDQFIEGNIMGGENQPAATGIIHWRQFGGPGGRYLPWHGNRNGHNVTDNYQFIWQGR